MPELRPYRPGDEQGICDLFSTCHGRPLPLDVWRWRYAPQNGTAPVIEVAVEAGRVVAHLGTLPVTLQRGEEALSAGLWVDLMVHPDSRNLSLFLDMAEANHRHCAEAGLRLVFAFPNDRSYPVLKRMLNWNTIEDIDALEAPLSELKPIPAETNIRKVSDFTSEYDDLWRRLRPDGAFVGTKTSAWLSWRYRQRPAGRYEAWCARNENERLSGWLVAKFFDAPQGRIGDILDFCAEPDSFDALWSTALTHFKTSGVQTISSWALRGSPLFQRFVGWGLAPRGPRTHFAGRWTSPNELAPFPARGEDWRVSKGDSDIF